MFAFTDSADASRDVLVTGIGIVTPLAVGREESWQRLLAGERAGRAAVPIGDSERLTRLLGQPAGGAAVDYSRAGQMLNQQLQTVPTGDRLNRLQLQDPLISLISFAALEAVQDAAASRYLTDNPNAGCLIGTSKSSLAAMHQQARWLHQPDSGTDGQPGRHWQQAFRADAPLQAVRQLTAATGPGSCPVAACATGLVSVIQAAAWLHSGMCDICLAGSVDASLSAAVLASFHRLGILSKHPDPATACRPFDAERDGFIIGEGAAVLVLETRQHAEARKANSYGRLLSGGWLSDPTGLTQIDTSGSIVAELLTQLQHRMGSSGRIDHINLHGTGTEPNDLAEAGGVRAAFGSQPPICSGLKGSLGHLLGGAGSVELALMLLSLRDQRLPPSVNLQSQDPRCDIPLTGPTAQPFSQQRLAKLSLGFGGHVAGCVVER